MKHLDQQTIYNFVSVTPYSDFFIDYLAIDFSKSFYCCLFDEIKKTLQNICYILLELV